MNVPGPRSKSLFPDLQLFESRNVTFVDDEFPVFWDSASGSTVVDVDGNRFTDLTSAFGVAGTGHSNPRVAEAVAQQSRRLMHAMGDVHPTAIKSDLMKKLAALAPGRANKVFLATTGSDAVEAAMKTAVIATGRSAFVSFEGAYHGLSLGALEVCGIDKFRYPFRDLLPTNNIFLPFPQQRADIGDLRALLRSRNDIAGVIVEPIQGRGGCRIPPEGYLSDLQAECTSAGTLFILDEIYTGFGRTGDMFAAEFEEVQPDIMCVGKALGNGFPISAIVARASVMDTWPATRGEALHTSTSLGNPMGCAAALANIDEIERLKLPERARSLGERLGTRLQRLRAHPNVLDIRGRGLMWGIEMRDAACAVKAVRGALRRGVIVLQAGPSGNVLSVTPPLIIEHDELSSAITVIEECLA
ncbi:MAG: aspartate aminotransferase family protein [Candidatus Eremiobacteraeota bacterium]|nr:aspartate aminotransferase family protein [Candidatus Eremiobacteraeota bacterium]